MTVGEFTDVCTSKWEIFNSAIENPTGQMERNFILDSDDMEDPYYRAMHEELKDREIEDIFADNACEIIINLK